MELITKMLNVTLVLSLFSGVMRKRAIDSFSSFRPAPAVQKRSECLQWIINMIVCLYHCPGDYFIVSAERIFLRNFVGKFECLIYEIFFIHK